ncbi:MAG: cytochrome c [Opitutaceae bacterium]|nr:cytochrome c [Opitutaceae bacterium]
MNADPAKNPRLEQAEVSDEQLQRVHAILLREKPEPTEGYSPLPLMLLGLMSACILFSAVYLGRYSGGFDPLVYDERILPGMLEGGVPPAVQDPRVVGKRIFMSNCSACHQPSGQGIPGVYPPLAGSEWVQGPETRIIRIVLHGLSGPITVKGGQFNNAMTAFGPLLKDEQIAAVLTYIRSDWDNNAPPVSPDRVKEIRAAVADRTGPWTADELRQVP